LERFKENEELSLINLQNMSFNILTNIYL